jgi:hypothetical protein
MKNEEEIKQRMIEIEIDLRRSFDLNVYLNDGYRDALKWVLEK